MSIAIADRTQRLCSCGEVVRWAADRERAIDRVPCPRCEREHLFSYFVKMDVGLSELCDLHCNMCRRPPDPKFLETNAVKQVMAEAAQMGLQVVSFCGGEPFMHKDFLDIVEYCFTLGLQVQLVTNGSLVTEKKIARLRPVDCLTVSIDGLRSNHDTIRGMEGSFDKALATVQMALKAGVTCGTNTVIQRCNVDDIWPLYQHLLEATDAKMDYIRFVPVEVTTFTEELMPTAEQLPRIREQLLRVAEDCERRDIWFCHRKQVVEHLPLFLDKLQRHRPLGGCHIPQRFIGYSYLGFYLCWHQGRSIRADSLIEALESPTAQEVVDEALASKCVGCNALTYSWDEEWNEGIIASWVGGRTAAAGLLDQETEIHGDWAAAK